MADGVERDDRDGAGDEGEQHLAEADEADPEDLAGQQVPRPHAAHQQFHDAGALLLRDTVGQAAILLAVGAAVGGTVGGLGGAALSTVAPFEASAVTVLLPVAGVVVIGLIGSVIATRRVTRVDPLLALGGN